MAPLGRSRRPWHPRATMSRFKRISAHLLYRRCAACAACAALPLAEAEVCMSCIPPRKAGLQCLHAGSGAMAHEQRNEGSCASTRSSRPACTPCWPSARAFAYQHSRTWSQSRSQIRAAIVYNPELPSLNPVGACCTGSFAEQAYVQIDAQQRLKPLLDTSTHGNCTAIGPRPLNSLHWKSHHASGWRALQIGSPHPASDKGPSIAAQKVPEEQKTHAWHEQDTLQSSW